MRIRRAGTADAAAVAALVRALGYAGGVDRVRDQLAGYERAEDDVVLVADRDGEVAGFVAVSRTRSLIDPVWFGRITALCVDADHRRAGVGAALVHAAEDWARERGVTSLQVTSGRRPERDAAHAFYPTLGYRDQHDHHVLYEKPLDG